MDLRMKGMIVSQSKIVLGIDPGWSSCGVSLNVDGKVEYVNNFVPKDSGDPHTFIKEVLEPQILLATKAAPVSHLYIERYVAYAGVHSNASEEILMNIGALCFWFQELNPLAIVRPVRAIDWKQQLCKYLVRTKGFNNPYPSFDKKFSIVAAKAVSGSSDIDTNHEADAICLSFMKEVEDFDAVLRQSKTTSR
jgi:hypothetical protein